jgi:hypothetical protein
MGFLASIGAWLLKQLTLKNLIMLAGLIAIVYVGWKVYDWVYARGQAAGVASQSKTISDLNTKLTAATTAETTAKNDLTAYKQQYANYVAQQQQTADQIAKGQAAIVTDLTTKLQASQKQVAQLQKVKNDISKYISKANDASCIIPNGFKFLYNASIQGTAGSLASGSAGDAYAPSGLSLTDIAGVILDNNTEASTNRNLVLAWIDWYNRNAALFQKYKLDPPPKLKLTTPASNDDSVPPAVSTPAK